MLVSLPLPAANVRLAGAVLQKAAEITCRPHRRGVRRQRQGGGAKPAEAEKPVEPIATAAQPADSAAS